MKITHILLAALVLLLPACETPDKSQDVGPTPTDIYESPGWQANTVTELAFDLREDGELDYVWPEDVPPDLRRKLEMRAIHLQDNWDGE